MSEEVTETNIMTLPVTPGSAWFSHMARKAVELVRIKIWVTLLIMLAIATINFVYNEVCAPLYRAEARFGFDDNLPRLDASRYFSDFGLYSKNARVEGILNRLRAPELNQALAMEPAVLRIIKIEDETRMQSPAWLNHVRTFLAGYFSTQTTKSTLPNRLMRAMTIRYETQDQSFHVSMTDTNPQLTQTVLDLLPDLYNRLYRVHTALPVVSDTELLNQQLKQMREETWFAEAPSIAGLRNGLTALPNTALLLQKISGHSNQKAILDGEEHLLSALLVNPTTTDLSELNDIKIKDQYRNIVLQKFKLQSLLSTYQVPPEEVSLLKSTITLDTIKLNNLVSAALGDINQARTKIQNQLTLPNAKTTTINDAAILATLLTTLNNNDGLFVQAEALIALAPATSLPDRPIAPNKPRNLVMGLIYGLATGIFIAAFIGFKDEKIATAADLEEEFHLPVLGFLPRVRE